MNNQLLNSLEAKINNTINSNIIHQTEINNDLYLDTSGYIGYYKK